MTATLQMLLDEGIGLYYRCRRCGYYDVLDASVMARALGPGFSVPRAVDDIICRNAAVCR